MLLQYEQAAIEFGMTSDDWRRAFVLTCLLLSKEQESAASFAAWACQVTGYERHEVETFIERGERGYLIRDGRPDESAFGRAMRHEEGGDVVFLLMVGVFQRMFERTIDDRYWLGGTPLPEDTARCEDGPGCVLATA